MTIRYGFISGCAAAGLLWTFACSPESGTADSLGTSSSAGGEGNGGGAGTGGGANGHADSGFVPNPDLGTGTSGDPGDGGLTADSSCAQSVIRPEPIEETVTEEIEINCTSEAPEPIALYIVLDNSGSMDQNNKWDDAVDALTAFVNSDTTLGGTGWQCTDPDGNSVPPPADLPPPGAGSISVAIQYFHPINVGSADECDGSGHRTPAVSMAPLPGNAANIINSLASTGPDGDTPTVGALTGGVAYCQEFQVSNPDQRCVTVLVTDGQPNGCGLSDDCPGGGGNCVDPNSASTLTPIASSAFTSSNSVTTFTVGMEGITTEGFVLLDAIAVAGGSDCSPTTPGAEACNVTTGGSQGFLDALNTIRDSVTVSGQSTQSVTTTNTVTTTLPCEWTIPEPDPGQEFDKDLVNVNISIGEEVQSLGNVPSESDCAGVGGGWYYDDNTAPTRILACPATCTVIESQTDVGVQVLIGCVTEPAMVH